MSVVLFYGDIALEVYKPSDKIPGQCLLGSLPVLSGYKFVRIVLLVTRLVNILVTIVNVGLVVAILLV